MPVRLRCPAAFARGRSAASLGRSPIVRVSSTCGDPAVAGRIGVVDGSHTGSGEVGVRIGELGDSITVQPQFLTPTGDRLPMPQAGRIASSTRVSVEGDVTGHTNFTIVDEIARYL